MDIDRSAPVLAIHEIEVDAPRESVWYVLTAIHDWPRWNPDVKSVEVRGPLAPGTVFRWKAGPSGITSRLEAIEAPSMIGWTGSTMGIRARHVYRLEARDGRTLVCSEESWRGLLPSILRGPMRRTLEGSLAAGLDALKTEVERGEYA